MICWILTTNLEDYKKICEAEGAPSEIIEQREDVCHVYMSSNISTIWNSVGYWYQMG